MQQGWTAKDITLCRHDASSQPEPAVQTAAVKVAPRTMACTAADAPIVDIRVTPHLYETG